MDPCTPSLGSAIPLRTPEPGGILPRELLDTLRRLGRRLNIVGADVVEFRRHTTVPVK